MRLIWTKTPPEEPIERRAYWYRHTPKSILIPVVWNTGSYWMPGVDAPLEPRDMPGEWSDRPIPESVEDRRSGEDRRKKRRAGKGRWTAGWVKRSGRERRVK